MRTPRLDLNLGAIHSLTWQGFVQGNRSHNRSQRATQVLAGPPVITVDEQSASEAEWQMGRGQLQWQHKAPDGVRLELKGSVQGTLSRGTGLSQGRDALQAPTLQRDSSHGVRESTVALGGRWRQPLAALSAAADSHTKHTLVLGWDADQRQRRELRRSIENGVELFTGSLGQPFTADIRRGVIFVQDEFVLDGWLPLPRLSALLGLRYEGLDITTTGPGQVFTQRPQALLPLLQLRHAWDDKGRDVLRLGLARSQRVPDVGLLLPRYALNGSYGREITNTPVAADSAGNPWLQPETALAFDAAFEKTLPSGSVFSASVFERRIQHLIRRRITLETVAEAPLPRWVSRPSNLGAARSQGLELEVKGRAEDLLPAWLWPPVQAGAARASGASGAAGAGLQLRASVSVYRSKVELIDDPEARLEGQAPWGATLGLDHRPQRSLFSWGANLVLSPGFSTQQSDRTRLWRGRSQRLDAYALWRFDRQTQLRLSGNNLLAADQLSSSQVADLDGFAASSQTRRETRRQLSLSWVQRF